MPDEKEFGRNINNIRDAWKQLSKAVNTFLDSFHVCHRCGKKLTNPRQWDPGKIPECDECHRKFTLEDGTA